MKGTIMKFIQPLLLTALLLAPLAWVSSASAETVKPNILFILTDDQGWTDFSEPYDPARPESCEKYFNTPRMNRLAKEGMRFTDAYSPSPICTPTRRSIQYGMTPARQHAVAFEGEFDPTGKWSIAQAMKNADPSYRCAHFGKWGGVHTGTWKDRKSQIPGYPGSVGYDEEDGPTCNPDGGGYGVYKRDVILEAKEDPKRTFSVNRRAIAFMEKNVSEQKPFYCQVSYYALHLALQARQETIDKYKNKPAPERQVAAGIGPMLEDMDTAIGELLDTLDRLGISENTYVFLTSDNGGQGFGRVALEPGFENSPERCYPLREHKGTIYEGGIRVPMMVRGPGIEPGSICRVPVAGYDLMPTFYDLAGGKAKIPQALDGGSMCGLLKNRGEGAVERVTDALIFHFVFPLRKTPMSSAYREGNMKLVVTKNTAGTQITNIELFDLDKDISESKNLAKAMPEKAQRLHKALDTYLEEVGYRLHPPNQ
jgi:arylsulfatase A